MNANASVFIPRRPANPFKYCFLRFCEWDAVEEKVIMPGFHPDVIKSLKKPSQGRVITLASIREED